MDTLRSFFGLFTSSVMRLAVTAGTLALIYFLVIKPVLDTTEEVSHSFNTGNNNISRSIQQSINQANQQVQQAVQQSINQTPNAAGQKKLLRCVQRAHGNVNRIQRCANRF